MRFNFSLFFQLDIIGLSELSTFQFRKILSNSHNFHNSKQSSDFTQYHLTFTTIFISGHHDPYLSLLCCLCETGIPQVPQPIVASHPRQRWHKPQHPDNRWQQLCRIQPSTHLQSNENRLEVLRFVYIGTKAKQKRHRFQMD